MLDGVTEERADALSVTSCLLVLSGGNAWASAHVWSPNGRKIAFTSWRDGNAEIYVMNTDGSGQRQPDAQPDGRPLGRLVARADEIGRRPKTVHENHQRAMVVKGQWSDPDDLLTSEGGGHNCANAGNGRRPPFAGVF